MLTYSPFLYLVVAIVLAFLTPITLAGQPVYSEENDLLYAQDFLHPLGTWRLGFETRKSMSEQLIAETPIIVRGIVVSAEYLIAKDEPLYKIVFNVSHTYRGSRLGDTITIYKTVEEIEGVVIREGKVHSLHHPHTYGLRIYKNREYIFFCKKNEQGTYVLMTPHRTTYIHKMDPYNRSWIGLFAMGYRDINDVNNHLSQFDDIRIPLEKE